jgi:hypothetical protein
LFVADDIGIQRDGGKAPIDRFIDHSPLDTEEKVKKQLEDQQKLKSI